MVEGFSDSIEELLPAYALNALDDNERDIVERALERDPRYQTMLGEYLQAAAALVPADRSMAAPDTVHERVMRQVWAPPAATSRTATHARPKLPIAMLGIAAAWLFAIFAVGTVEMVHAHRVNDLKDEMNTLAQANQRQAERLQQQEDLASFAGQPGVSQASMVSIRDPQPPKDPPMGFVYTNMEGKQVLFAMNMDQTDPGYLYRVWLFEGASHIEPLATFTVDQAGEAYVPMWLSGQRQSPMWITIHMEPDEAGNAPQGPQILWGRLR